MYEKGSYDLIFMDCEMPEKDGYDATRESRKIEKKTEKHIPIVTFENIGGNKHLVKVDVGGGKHPNEVDHWIQWVEIRMNDLFIGRAEFSAKVTDPIAHFVVECNHACKITALARCNKHGIWQSSVSTCS